MTCSSADACSPGSGSGGGAALLFSALAPSTRGWGTGLQENGWEIWRAGNESRQPNKQADFHQQLGERLARTREQTGQDLLKGAGGGPLSV